MDTPDQTSPAAPWAAADLFPLKPDGAPFGYRRDGESVAASREELIERVRAEEPRVELVWTPADAYTVPPAEVDFLIEPVCERTRADLLFNFKNSLMVLAIWAGVVSIGRFNHQSTDLSLVLLLLLGVAPAAQDLAGLWKVRRSHCYVQGQATVFRYQIWLGTRPIVTTWLLAACITIVGIAQLLRPGSIEAAGLVKEVVINGQQYWRLLTCTLLHGNVLHFIFNMIALFALGRLLEVHTHATYLPIVFLMSAIVGSICSVALMPGVNSVGASGGLMGMIGFLAVLGVRRRRVMPPGFLKAIVLSIALTAGAGVLAPKTIDNAAHFGGLVGGVILGIIYISRQSSEVRLKPSLPTFIAGATSILALVAITAFTLLRVI